MFANRSVGRRKILCSTPIMHQAQSEDSLSISTISDGSPKRSKRSPTKIIKSPKAETSNQTNTHSVVCGLQTVGTNNNEVSKNNSPNPMRDMMELLKLFCSEVKKSNHNDNNSKLRSYENLQASASVSKLDQPHHNVASDSGIGSSARNNKRRMSNTDVKIETDEVVFSDKLELMNYLKCCPNFQNNNNNDSKNETVGGKNVKRNTGVRRELFSLAAKKSTPSITSVIKHLYITPSMYDNYVDTEKLANEVLAHIDDSVCDSAPRRSSRNLNKNKDRYDTKSLFTVSASVLSDEVEFESVNRGRKRKIQGTETDLKDISLFNQGVKCKLERETDYNKIKDEECRNENDIKRLGVRKSSRLSKDVGKIKMEFDEIEMPPKGNLECFTNSYAKKINKGPIQVVEQISNPTSISTGLLKFKPGASNNNERSSSDLSFHILKGKAMIKVGRKQKLVETKQSVFVPKGMHYSITNGSDKFTMLLAYSRSPVNL